MVFEGLFFCAMRLASGRHTCTGGHLPGIQPILFKFSVIQKFGDKNHKAGSPIVNQGFCGRSQPLKKRSGNGQKIDAHGQGGDRTDFATAAECFLPCSGFIVYVEFKYRMNRCDIMGAIHEVMRFSYDH